MPTYYYEGRTCERVFEQERPLEDYAETVECVACDDHGCVADIALLPSWGRYNAKPPSVVYYENAAGKVMVASGSNDPVPEGWRKCETSRRSDLHNIERRLDREELRKREQFIEREQRHFEATVSQERRDLRAYMEQGFYADRHDEAGNVTHREYVPTSEFFKDFARAAMRRNDNRRSQYDKRVEPGNHFFVLNYDDGKRR